MALAMSARRQAVIANIRFRFQASQCGSCDDESDIQTWFSPRFLFPFPHHSTCDPYSNFIHLQSARI